MLVVKKKVKVDGLDSSLSTVWRQLATPVSPVYFFSRMLEDRGYDFSHKNAHSMRNLILPNAKLIHDYDKELIDSVRRNDLIALQKQASSGKTMSACNRYSESVLHIACRRSELAVVNFILCNGGQADLIDDYGRTPLHDAFWRPEPHFAIVEALLEHNVYLMSYADVRGSIPLHYTREEDWAQWCDFLYSRRDKFWPICKGD